MSLARYYRVVRSNPPKPEDFFSLERHGTKPRPGTPRSVLERWDHVSVFGLIKGAYELARNFPRKGRWIAVLDIPDDAPITLHPRIGDFNHRDIKASPEVFLRYVVDVVPASEPSSGRPGKW